MKLSQIISDLKLEGLNNKTINEDMEIDSAYVSDLLSQVMGSAKSNSIWMTVQSHLNIVGVAEMTGISAIIICEGHQVADNVITKADDERIAMFKSGEDAYHLAGKLYAMGIQ